jgi:hypothetical protein
VKRNSEKNVLKRKGRSKIRKKRVFCKEAKKFKRNSENNRSKTMRNEAKKLFFGFAKTSENEAKQDVFRFISLRSENLKRAKKGHPNSCSKIRL